MVGRKPGTPKTGGRQKGTPNKKTQELLEICEEEGIDPFRAMLRLIPSIHNARDKFDALEKIAQYLYPKRKQMEMDVPPDAGFKIVIEDYSTNK